MTLKYVVLGGTFQRFDYWCRTRNINPRSREVLYVNGFRPLMGFRFQNGSPELHINPDWWGETAEWEHYQGHLIAMGVNWDSDPIWDV